MRTARSVVFVVLCAGVAAAVGMPALRAQRSVSVANSPRDVRSVAQNKIAPRLLSEIYRRRGDARQNTVTAERGVVHVDRHGRVLVDVRADVKPALEKKMRALGGVIVSANSPSRSIVSWMPLTMLERLAADPGVTTIDVAH